MSPELSAVLTLNAVPFSKMFKLMLDMGGLRERMTRIAGRCEGVAARQSQEPG